MPKYATSTIEYNESDKSATDGRETVFFRCGFNCDRIGTRSGVMREEIIMQELLSKCKYGLSLPDMHMHADVHKHKLAGMHAHWLCT